MKLHTKILLPLSVISVCAIVAITAISYFLAQQEIVNIYKSQIQETVESVREEIETTAQVQKTVLADIGERNLALNKALVELIAQRPELTADPNNQNASAFQALADQFNISEVHVADENGILRWSNVPKFYGFDFYSTDQARPFTEILKNPDLEIIQEPQENSIGEIVQYTAVATVDGKGFVQVGIQADMLAELNNVLSLQNHIRSMHIGTTGSVSIIQDGVFIAHNNAPLVGTDASTVLGLTQTEAVHWVKMYGKKYLASIAPYEDMIIAIYLPESEYSASLNTMWITNGIVGIITLLILVLALFFCIHSIVLKPIRELSNNLRLIKQGRISETNIKHQSKDELGQLASDMRDISNGLKLVMGEQDAILTSFVKGNFSTQLCDEKAYEERLQGFTGCQPEDVEKC